MGFFSNLPKFPYGDWQNLNLDWFLAAFKKLCQSFDDLSAKFDSLLERIAQIDDNLEQAMLSWLEAHGVSAVRQQVDQYIQCGVWFGLNDNGNLVAYQPSGWSNLTFATTGYDITLPIMPEYGHLVIKFPGGTPNV